MEVCWIVAAGSSSVFVFVYTWSRFGILPFTLVFGVSLQLMQFGCLTRFRFFCPLGAMSRLTAGHFEGKVAEVVAVGKGVRVEKGAGEGVVGEAVKLMVVETEPPSISRFICAWPLQAGGVASPEMEADTIQLC
jgi:hypothetical protein